LTLEAEAWAEAGTRKLVELPLARQAGPLRSQRADHAHSLAGPHAAAGNALRGTPESIQANFESPQINADGRRFS